MSSNSNQGSYIKIDNLNELTTYIKNDYPTQKTNSDEYKPERHTFSNIINGKRINPNIDLEHLVFETGVVTTALKSKVSNYGNQNQNQNQKSKEGRDKIDLAITIDSDGTLYQVLHDELKEAVIQFILKNKDNIKYSIDDDDDESDIREQIEHNYHPPIHVNNKGYAPIMNIGIYERELKQNIVKTSNNTFITEKEDFITQFNRGAECKMLLRLSHINITETSIKPFINVVRVNHIKKGEGVKINYQDVLKNTTDWNKFVMKPPKTNERGGKSSMFSYNNGIFGMVFSTEHQLLPWSIENTQKLSGELYYEANYSVGDELLTYFSNFEERVVSIMVDNWKDYTGKKLSKKLATKQFKGVLLRSKDDAERVKNGEEPKYPPRFRASIPKYNDEFKFVFEDSAGKVLDNKTFPQFHEDHKQAKYKSWFRLVHGWYGEHFTVKFVLDKIQIVDYGSSSGFDYSFDDDEVPNTNTNTNSGGSAGDTNDAPAEDSENEDSSNDEQDNNSNDGDSSDSD